MTEQNLAKPRRLWISDYGSPNGKAAKRPSHCEGRFWWLAVWQTRRYSGHARITVRALALEFGRHCFSNKTLRSPRSLRFEVFGLHTQFGGQVIDGCDLGFEEVA